jgi:hypothetical protein
VHEGKRTAGIRTICGPVCFVVEWSRVPYYLVHQLWNADGVSGWAASSKAEEVGRTTCGISNVSFVVWAVKVLAIPAAMSPISGLKLLPELICLRREMNIGPDSALADVFWQAWGVKSILCQLREKE